MCMSKQCMLTGRNFARGQPGWLEESRLEPRHPRWQIYPSYLDAIAGKGRRKRARLSADAARIDYIGIPKHAKGPKDKAPRPKSRKEIRVLNERGKLPTRVYDKYNLGRLLRFAWQKWSFIISYRDV